MKYERILSQKEKREIKAEAKAEKKFRKHYKSKVHFKRLPARKTSKHFQKETPHSELWFYEQLAQLKFPCIPAGQYPDANFGLGIRNPQYDHYVPDIQNTPFKFLIEVDDASHRYKSDKDKTRDKYFGSNGFRTYRITYNDLASLVSKMTQVCYRILEHPNMNCPDTRHLLTEWLTLHNIEYTPKR